MMKHFKALFIIALLLTGIIGTQLSVSAGVNTLNVEVSRADCESLDFHAFTVGYGYYYGVTVRVWNSSEKLIGSADIPFMDYIENTDVYDTITFNTAVADGETIYVDIGYDSKGFFVTDSLTLRVSCGGSEAPEDGRFCFAPGEARAAVYFTYEPDKGGYGIEIWAINANNQGEPVIEMTAGEMNEVLKKADFDKNPRTILLNSSIFNSVKFYRLADGSYQINVGPAGEKKVHVCIFDSIPPSKIKKANLNY